MKVYIVDGTVNFYQYKIDGQDNLSRPITLYAKNDADKTIQLTRVLSPTVTDITPTSGMISKANDWQLQNKNKVFNISDIESYINASVGTPLSTTFTGNEIIIHSINDTSNKFTIIYNETTNTLDINY